MNICGLDIGTTTISAVAVDARTGKLQKAVTLKNDSFINSKKPFEKSQDVKKIVQTAKEALKAVSKCGEFSSLGVTGQMHGILYVDKDFNAVSPLYTWQDERGNEIYDGKTSYAEYLTESSHYKAAAGFGLTTHFYNLKNGLVPEEAVKMCTIHDYIACLLTGQKKLLMHSSNAASYGFYDIKNQCFDKDALKSVGIDPAILPNTTYKTELLGITDCSVLPTGIPVSVAIGDNQASFFGSVGVSVHSVLINVGTGSQVSFITESTDAPSSGEIRPLTDDKYIYVGSSLCGGRAYQILKNFFLECGDMFSVREDKLYKKMDELSEKAFNLDNPLKVNCEFCGTRENPAARGSIENMGIDNFTPTHLICGVLLGTVNELYGMYESAKPLLYDTPKRLVGSGNGIRKSAVWRKMFEKEFSLPLIMPKSEEEAATGASIFSAVAAGSYTTFKDAFKSF